MPHKPECDKTKDPTKPCNLNCEAPATQTCWDCEQEIGANETKCPKCGVDLKLAKEEDDTIERSLKRLAKKNKKKKAAAAPPADPNAPTPKRSIFSALNRMK